MLSYLNDHLLEMSHISDFQKIPTNLTFQVLYSNTKRHFKFISLLYNNRIYNEFKVLKNKEERNHYAVFAVYKYSESIEFGYLRHNFFFEFVFFRFANFHKLILNVFNHDR